MSADEYILSGLTQSVLGAAFDFGSAWAGDHAAQRRSNEAYARAASEAIAACEAHYPGGSPVWNEVVTCLANAERTQPLVHAIQGQAFGQTAPLDVSDDARPFVLDFARRLVRYLAEAVGGKDRIGVEAVLTAIGGVAEQLRQGLDGLAGDRVTDEDWHLQPERPNFRVHHATRRFQGGVDLEWDIEMTGAAVPSYYWRVRSQWASTEWSYAERGTNNKERVNLTVQFEKGVTPDPEVGADRLGIEVAFYWKGAWRHILRRWPFNGDGNAEPLIPDLHSTRGRDPSAPPS